MHHPLHRLVILSLVIVLIAGGILTWMSVMTKEGEMRENILTDSRIAAKGIVWDDLNQLSGTGSDLESPAYNRIKQFLADISKARPNTRFAYLFGKNSDGTIVILVDSEPISSDMYSEPGQNYTEASQIVQDIFIYNHETFEGPLSDRWGRWVSSLIPLTDPGTQGTKAIFGIDVDASNWEQEVMRAALIPILVTILLCILILFIYSVWLRKEREQELLKSAEEQSRAYAIELERQNTELRKVKEELALLTVDLENRVSDGTSEILKLNDELKERANKVEHLLIQKDHFIYQLAHDLRTPMTPMVAILPLLKESITDPDSRTLLDMFQKSVQYMQIMVEDILEFVHLNSQHTIDEFEEVNLKELINDEIATNAFMADEKEIVFENQIPPEITIRVSRVYSRQLFRNLINNAIKYNSFKGMITFLYQETLNERLISIRDTGVGIDPNNLYRIWDEFYITDNSRHDPESKGLGLSIVRKIVELHGGRITADSQGIGKGATFTISLPKKSR